MVETPRPGGRSLRMVVGATLVGVTLLLSTLLVVAGLSHQHSLTTATTPPRSTPLPGWDAAPPAVASGGRPEAAAVEPGDWAEATASASAAGATPPAPAAPPAPVVSPARVPEPARAAGDDF